MKDLLLELRIKWHRVLGYFSDRAGERKHYLTAVHLAGGSQRTSYE